MPGLIRFAFTVGAVPLAVFIIATMLSEGATLAPARYAAPPAVAAEFVSENIRLNVTLKQP